MVSGRQSVPASRGPASRGPAQTDGDLGWLKREDKGTELRNTRKGRVRGRQEGKGKQRETQANRCQKQSHRKHERGRDKIETEQRQRKSEIKMKDPGWKRRKDRKRLRELFDQTHGC